MTQITCTAAKLRPVPTRRWWAACPEHGKDRMPSGSCHECAMLMPDPTDPNDPASLLDTKPKTGGA